MDIQRLRYLTGQTTGSSALNLPVVCADYPHTVRTMVEAAMPVHCIFFSGAQGCYPMYEYYAEGGYEAVSSNYKAGVAERLIETGTEFMNSLK